MRDVVEKESFHLTEVSETLPSVSSLRLQHISSSYSEQSSITAEEAKIRFLEVLSTRPTFGCSFFEAKVTRLLKVLPGPPRRCASALRFYLFLRSKRASRASPTPSWS